MDIRSLPVIVLFSICALAQETGSIRGVVTGQDGTPLADAQVHLSPIDSARGVHRIIQFYPTNAKGEFVIDRIPPGPYIVHVGKEQDGYPDSKFAFYSNFNLARVNVAPATTMQKLTIRLGPKAGILNIDSVTDATTGKPVPSAVVTLRRAGTDLYITTSTTVKIILVPAMTHVEVEVHAEGYSDWYFPGSPDSRSRSREDLYLKPSETMRLDVVLQPKMQ